MTQHIKKRGNPRRIALMLALISVSCAIFATKDTSPFAASVLKAASFGAYSPQNTTSTSDISVLWIVLDEAPLFPLITTKGDINAKRFPGFASLASNSTWYRNVVGTAQRTTEAVPALLDGNWPSYKKYPLLRDHPNNLFTLMNGRKNLDVYQSVTQMCPPKACANRMKGEGKTPVKQAKILQSFIDKSVASTEPTLHFAHVLLPHRPWVLAPDLRASTDLGKDTRRGTVLDRRRDVYQSLLRQYVATDAIIGDLVARLKASQNWNRTMVIVTADHGITFVPGESVRDDINPLSKGTLEDIYRIPLFIKYPDQQSGTISDCTASSIDILATVIETTKITPKWKTDGSDLQHSCAKRKSRTIRWPYSSTTITTGFKAVIKRAKYYNSWVSANGDVDDIYRVGRSKDLIGTSVPTEYATDKNVVWTLDVANTYQKVAMGPFMSVPIRASGDLLVNKRMCPRCEGLIVVNDKIVGAVPELSDAVRSPLRQQFSSSLMSRLIMPGDNKVELWIADWTTKQVELRRVGPPLRRFVAATSTQK